MIIYEISNPSDAYTIAAPNLETAAIAVLFLGEGAYGLLDTEGNQAMPIFLLGGHEEWFQGKFGGDFNTVFHRVGYIAIADCLDTILLGDVADREVYDAALEAARPSGIVSFQSAWDKAHRSSVNDIGAGAKRLASGFRELAAKLADGDGARDDAR